MRTMLALVAFGMALWPQDKTKEITAFTAEQVRWVEAPDLSKGAFTCLQYGNPQTGPHLMRIKLPAGAVRPPHFHSADECVTVLSGRIILGKGEAIDEKFGYPVGGGGYVVIPAKVPHWVVVKEDSVLTIMVNGPRDAIYCNPDDDQKNKK